MLISCIMLSLACQHMMIGVILLQRKNWVRQSMNKLCMIVRWLLIRDLYVGVRQLPMKEFCVGVRRLQLEIWIGLTKLLADGCYSLQSNNSKWMDEII
jgi:hypothetical protein